MTLTTPRRRGPALRDYQARTLLSLRRGMATNPGATFTVMFPRQAGKNEVAAVLVAGLLRENAARGGTVVVCAPTMTPQGAISFDRAKRLLAASEHVLPEGGRTVFEGANIRVGRASAIYLSASPAAHVAGHTASLALIADEAQDIEADWFNRQFRPMAASTGAPTVLFGTPWDGHTLLEEVADANRRRDAKQRGQRYLHFDPFHHEVRWQEVADSNPRYGDYVRSERARLGANHPLYITQYELLPAQGAGGMFSVAQLARLDSEYPRLRAALPGERYVAGLDLGGQGEHADRTVLTIARIRGSRCEVVEHITWRSTSFGVLVAGIIEAARQWRIERLCADATGMGAALVSQLAEALGSTVEPFVFSSTSKSELGYGLLAAIDTGRLSLYAPDSSAERHTCLAELHACRATLRGHSLMQWQAPPGAHDDYVASLALCLRAAQGAPAPKLAFGHRRH